MSVVELLARNRMQFVGGRWQLWAKILLYGTCYRIIVLLQWTSELQVKILQDLEILKLGSSAQRDSRKDKQTKAFQQTCLLILKSVLEGMEKTYSH